MKYGIAALSLAAFCIGVWLLHPIIGWSGIIGLMLFTFSYQLDQVGKDLK